MFGHSAGWVLIGCDAGSSNTGQHLKLVVHSLLPASEQLSTSLSPSLKSLLATLFSPSASLSSGVRGFGPGSLAEVRFGVRGGMVEPLIFRKGRPSPEEKRTHLGRVRHKSSLPPASLRCLQGQTLDKGAVVY